MMDESKRFRVFVGVLVAVVVGGVVFVISSVVADAEFWFTVVSVLILVSMALVAVLVARKRQKELKSGFPPEDERSRALNMRAGYLAFWVSIYLCLALGWIIGAFVDESTTDFLSVGEMMFVLTAAMGISYLAIRAVLTRGKGTP